MRDVTGVTGIGCFWHGAVIISAIKYNMGHRNLVL